MKSILIVGANFTNKGAQSMLFITVDEIKRRIPGVRVYYGGAEPFDEKRFEFSELFYTEDSKSIALRRCTFFLKLKCVLKDIIKPLFGKKNNLFRFGETKELFPELNLVIDISGFNLGSKWDIETQEAYLQNIRLAKKYNIPIIMMPQSFGDFNYSKEKAYLLSEIGELLKYPKLIFAREREGYQFLRDIFHLGNIRLSTDLVLQNTGVDLSNIYKKIPCINVPNVQENAVAIVPNKQCFNHGDKDSNLKIYKELITHLISIGKKVYVFRHSREDFLICQMIVEQFKTGTDQVKNDNIVLLDNEFSCFEYDEFIKGFDFVICSRFHGIVHAYRNYVPCILLGWAIKYFELAENVGQKQFAFDITDEDFNISKVITAVDELDSHLTEMSQTIARHVEEIQTHNCFDQIEECLC